MTYLKSMVAFYELNKTTAIYINMEKNKVTLYTKAFTLYLQWTKLLKLTNKLLAWLVAVYLYTLVYTYWTIQITWTQ